MVEKQINVTRPYLPPLDEYVRYLEGIWARGQLTNHGPLACELEEQLERQLGVKHLFFVNNGTVALQIALKALNLQGDVLTTPFSYVATTSSIVWEKCRPVFVDIDPATLCLNPDLIEPAITPETQAILAVHIYGYPCDVERIQAIADRHGLKVIYDAAHVFYGQYKGHSLLAYGDISTLSFHATKIFHTVEGGAVVTDNDDLAEKIAAMRYFGFNGPGEDKALGLGIDGKNSEFHAAMGLCLLPKVSELIAARKGLSELYDELLGDLELTRPVLLPEATYDYAYYPILFSSEAVLLGVLSALNAQGIYPKRYFYPALNTLPYVTPQPMPVAEDVARRVLCLPLYDGLEPAQVHAICEIIRTQVCLCR